MIKIHNPETVLVDKNSKKLPLVMKSDWNLRELLNHLIFTYLCYSFTCILKKSMTITPLLLQATSLWSQGGRSQALGSAHAEVSAALARLEVLVGVLET